MRPLKRNRKTVPVGFGRISNGVDLVEYKRAKSFFRRHRSHLTSLFSQRELLFIQKGPRPEERLAAVLAAKEAVYKAVGAPKQTWLGFTQIEVVPKKSGRVTCAWTDRRRQLSIRLFKTRRFVVASCVPKGVSCAGI